MGTPEREAREQRAWERIGGGLVKGMLIGAIIGAIIGLILGTIAFEGFGAIVGAVVAGVVGIGGLGAFWGTLSGLESPDAGEEPLQADRPLGVRELTAEERDRRDPQR